jgi:spermidine synthase
MVMAAPLSGGGAFANKTGEERTILVEATRRRLLQWTTGLASSFALGAAAAKPDERVRESVYNYIIVTLDDSKVSFRRLENGAEVSAIDINRPSYQIIPYTKYLFAAALVNDAPAKALSIGLGAGSFNRLFNLRYPGARLTTVEIDRMILDLAVEYTAFRQSANNAVVIDDGRRFLHKSDDRWDWIVIDAFVRNSQYPSHLATHEFFTLVADHLSDGGVLAINVIRGNKLFGCLVATINIVFPNCLVYEVPDSGNAIVLAAKNAAPPIVRQLKTALVAQGALMKDNGVDLSAMRTTGAPPTHVLCAAPLTDDFAPTEFLGGQP